MSRNEVYRLCKLEWPNDTAVYRKRNLYRRFGQHFDAERLTQMEGIIHLEVPLASRHVADLRYILNGNQQHENGTLKVVYNDNSILNGTYRYRGEIDQQNQSIFNKVTDISVENELKSMGLHYKHLGNLSIEQNEPSILDHKHVEVFELMNAENFNLTGELYSITTNHKQAIKLVAIHPNRTIIINTDYQHLSDSHVKQQSRIELSSNVWFGYNFELKNYSTVRMLIPFYFIYYY